MKNGFLCAVGCRYDYSYPKDVDALEKNYKELLEKGEASDLEISLWKNDRAFGKIDVITEENAEGALSVEVKGFENFSGKVSAKFIKNCEAHDIKVMVPDIIYNDEPVDVKGRQIVSVWVEAVALENCGAGSFTGKIIVKLGDNEKVIDVTVKVVNATFKGVSSELELWQYPYSSNRYYSGLTTEEYFEGGKEGIFRARLDPKYDEQLLTQLKLYKANGGNCVTTTINEDPWNSQTPDPYPSMVKWTKHQDGTFSFTFEDFDRWIALNKSVGIDGPILCFSIANWANNVTYYDKALGEVVVKELSHESEEWQYIWKSFLTALVEHCDETGVFDRVHISIDERAFDLVKAVVELNESVKNCEGKSLKMSLAIFSLECEPLFDRFARVSCSVRMECEKVKTWAAERREKGLVTTFYTCGAENSSLVNRPYEGFYSMLFIKKWNTDGFLRWAFDAFNAEPLESSEHRLYAAGDLYLVYPEKRGKAPCTHSSVRFEMITAGLRMIEKLKIIEKAYGEEGAAGVAEILSLVDDKIDKAESLEAVLHAVNGLKALESKLL